MNTTSYREHIYVKFIIIWSCVGKFSFYNGTTYENILYNYLLLLQLLKELFSVDKKKSLYSIIEPFLYILYFEFYFNYFQVWKSYMKVFSRFTDFPSGSIFLNFLSLHLLLSHRNKFV